MFFLPPHIDPFGSGGHKILTGLCQTHNVPILEHFLDLRDILVAIIYIFVAFWNCPLKFGSGAFRGSHGGWWSDHPGPHSMTHTKQSQFMDHRCSSTSRWAPTALGLFWRPGRPHSHMTLPTSYNGVWQNTQPTLVDSVIATRVWSRQLYFLFSSSCQSTLTWMLHHTAVTV